MFENAQKYEWIKRWREVKTTASSIVKITIIGLVVGAVSATLALAFINGVNALNDYLFISAKSRFLLSENAFLLTILTIVMPTLGGLIVGLLMKHVSELKRPLGPADVIYGVQSRQINLLNVKEGMVSTVSALFALGFGASVGQYGPVVAMGGVIGTVARRLRINVENVVTIGIACGVAAAISATFNAPIAGILFAHEAIVRHYSLQTFAPVTVSSAVGYIIANAVFHRTPFFEVSFAGVEYGYEFILFGLLGIISAGIAYAFMHAILYFGELAQRLKLWDECKPALAGLILGLVAISTPEVLSIGKEALRFATIDGAYQNAELLWIITAKLLLTALCLGFGIAGGAFSPALLIGILSGALFSNMIGVLGIDNSGVVVYAVCAMIAVASPVIGAPLTMILIVFELTRSYDITIAAMVCVVFSNLLANKIFSRSLFDMQLKHRGMNLSKGRDQAILAMERIMPYADHNVESLPIDTQIASAIETLLEKSYREVSVVNENNEFVGRITLAALMRFQSENPKQPFASIESCIDRNSLVFYDETTVWEAMQEVKDFIGDRIAILDSKENKKLIGEISEGQVLQAYFESTQYMRDEENAGI